MTTYPYTLTNTYFDQDVNIKDFDGVMMTIIIVYLLMTSD